MATPAYHGRGNVVNRFPSVIQQNSTRTPIYVNGRVVGYVAGATFHKTIHGSRHLLKTPAAIALDLGNVRDAQRAGATHAEVTDAETGHVYRAALDIILRDGREFDRGFGRQIYLPLDRWLRPDQGQGEQLTLFGGMGA